MEMKKTLQRSDEARPHRQLTQEWEFPLFTSSTLESGLARDR